jgi:hypothetical protein
MTETISGIQILEALKSAVNAAGPDTKRECKYVVEAEPGKFEAHCIAGTVLADLGAPLSTLFEYEDVNIPAIQDRNPWSGTRGSGPKLPFEIDEPGWRILDAAQMIQDAGNDWGYALESAEDEARRLGVVND